MPANLPAVYMTQKSPADQCNRREIFYNETNIFQTRNFTPVFHQNNIDIKTQKRYNYVNKDKLFPGFFVTSMRKHSAALQVKVLFLYLNKFAAVCGVFSDNYIANDIK